MATILKLQKNPSFVVLTYGYYVYVDSDIKLDSSSLKLFTKEYKPSDNDLLIKTVPSLKDNDAVQGRYSDPYVTRYLYAINKINKDKVKELSKFLQFDLPEESDQDTRELVVDLPTTKVVDYSDKSYAIFTTDKDLIEAFKALKEEKKSPLLFSRGLTGPGLEKMPGYVLSKKSKKKDEIFSMLKGSVESFNDEILLMEAGPLGESRFKLKGSPEYCKNKMDEFYEDHGTEKVKFSDVVMVNENYKTMVVTVEAS